MNQRRRYFFPEIETVREITRDVQYIKELAMTQLAE